MSSLSNTKRPDMPTNDSADISMRHGLAGVLVVTTLSTGGALVSLAQSAGLDTIAVDIPLAFERIAVEPPSLVAVDAGAVGFDAAVAFVERVRASDESRFLPILLTAPLLDSASRTRAYHAGVDAIESIDVGAGEFAARISALLRPRSLSQNLVDENRELQAAYEIHRESEQLYRALFEALPLPCLVIEPARVRIAFANERAALLTGHTYETLRDKELDYICPGENAEWMSALSGKASLDGAVHADEGTIVSADGQRIAVDAALVRFDCGDRRYVALTLVDLRHRIEDDLDKIAAERTNMLRETAIAVNSRINDPLFVILNDVAVLQTALEGADPAVQSRLSRMLEAAQRIQRVTAQLSAVSTVVTKDYLPGVRMLDLDESTS